MIFCDTSAAAKIYVRESDSPAVKRLFEEQEQVYLSELTRVELMNVFHRRLRERIWSKADFTAALRQFSRDDICGFWNWLPLDRLIIDAAVKTYTSLPDNVFLRSSDCLHLATALYHNFSEIYTYDSHQAQAAPILGIKAVTATSDRPPPR